jgi:hypothetical protein
VQQPPLSPPQSCSWQSASKARFEHMCKTKLSNAI